MRRFKNEISVSAKSTALLMAFEKDVLSIEGRHKAGDFKIGACEGIDCLQIWTGGGVQPSTYQPKDIHFELETHYGEALRLAGEKEEEEFKVGDWVKVVKFVEGGELGRSNHDIGDVFQISEIVDSTCEGVGKWVYEKCGNPISIHALHKSTPQEIESHLISEAKKRGLDKIGAKFYNVNKDYGRNEHLESVSEGRFQYIKEEDLLYVDGNTCYHKGTWAEVLPSHPQIEINGYKAEFFEDHVSFGCAKFDRRVFTVLQEVMNGKHGEGSKSNRKLVSVKLGEGEFSREQIIEIADHFKGGNP